MARIVRGFASVLLGALAACGGGGGGGGGTESGLTPYTLSVTVSGLSGTVVLQNNGGNNLSTSANGSITFSATLIAGDPYSVAVLTQPAGQNCSVTNGSGTMPSANVTIAVACALIAPTVSVQPGVKQLQFAWAANPAATHYRVLENLGSGPAQLGGNLMTTSYTLDLSGVLLSRRVNASYIIESCYSFGCTDSAAVNLAAQLVNAIGYFKASNTGANDFFGASVALSADGSTLAIAAPEEDSGSPGINGNQADNSNPNTGAVYVFVRVAGAWSQQAYVKASDALSNPGITNFAGVGFGYSLALSADGSTLAVGAPFDPSASTGIGGTQGANCRAGQLFNCAIGAGAVYVFARNVTTWSQQAYVKPSNTVGDNTSSGGFNPSMNFGAAVTLSADGNRLAIGAPGESGGSSGIGVNQTYNCNVPINCVRNSGAAYTFVRTGGTTWAQQTYIKASHLDLDARAHFGRSLALSGDGNTLAVAAPGENSIGRTINGNQIADCAVPGQCRPDSGAVYVFAFASAWTQQAFIKTSNADMGDSLGGSGVVALSPTATLPVTMSGIALSSDGNTLAVGASNEASAATGINNVSPGQNDNSLAGAGAVYVFSRSGTTWSQQAYVKAPNSGTNDNFGGSVSLSPDGNTLSIGADGESSAATGINGNQLDNNSTAAGAAYLFTRSGATWTQHAYVKASNTRSIAHFGRAVALSGDGTTLVVGGLNESSANTGIGGDQGDISLPGAGAVYLY